MKIARKIGGLESQRTPDLGVRLIENASRRKHANHFVRHAVKHNLSADDVRIAPELRLPQSVTENRHALFAQLIFVFGERAA